MRVRRQKAAAGTRDDFDKGDAKSAIRTLEDATPAGEDRNVLGLLVNAYRVNGNPEGSGPQTLNSG